MPREIDFTGYDETCIDFLTSHNTGTKHTYKSLLKLFLNFTGMTGQQILDSKRLDKNFEWENKIIKFKQWMKTQKNRDGNYYSDNAVNTAVHATRSFFDYYRLPLEFNHNEARKLSGKAQRVTRDYVLSNPDISKMAFVGDLREKYIVLLGKSLGLRASDFVRLTYGTFRSINLDQEPPISLGEIQTIKEKITAHPFIDADASPIVKQILDSNRNKPNDERIITVKEAELSSIIQALAKKANINLGDKHLRFHCFRKYLIDRLSASNSSESKWKQIVGKAVSEEAYVSTFELRECYLQTMKLTTLNTNGNGKVSKLSEQITELVNENSKNSKIINALVQDLNKKDVELESVKSELSALGRMVRQIANSDDYKRIADEVLEKVADELIKKPEFMKKFKEDAEKLKLGYFKSTTKEDKEIP
jgi:integrase